MTASNVKLLPLPEPDLGLLGQIAFIRSDKLLLKWCHTNVEHHTAAQAAEIEALRAEVGRAWKAEDEWRRVANTNGGRAERLAGALKRARESIEEWAYFAQSCGGEITGLQEELSEIDLTLTPPSPAAP